MQKVLYRRNYINTLYVSIKVVGGRLDSMENCIDASIQELRDETKKSNDSQLQHCQHKYRRKTNLLKFTVENRLDRAREDLDMDMKKEPQEIN